MRIAIVIHEYPPLGGGAATAARATARALAADGHPVMVVTSAAAGEPRSARLDGVEVRRLPALRLRTLAPSHVELLSFCASAAVRLTSELRDFRAEGILAYFAVPAGPFAVRAGHSLGVPVVVSLRGSDVPGFPGGRLEGRLGAIARPVLRRALARATVVAPNSEGLRALALAFMPSIAPRTIVVPNGVDEELVARAPAGSHRGVFEIIQVGQLIERKRVHLALESLRSVRDAGVDARLTIVGDGPLRGDLAARADTLGIAPSVELAGHLAREAIPARLRTSDVFLMTSEGEGMSNALVEAMAAGLPIVTTRSGSEDVVERAGCGLVVTAAPADIAGAIRSLAADPGRRRDLAAAGLEWAGRHTWRETARAFVELLAATRRAS